MFAVAFKILLRDFFKDDERKLSSVKEEVSAFEGSKKVIIEEREGKENCILQV